MPLDADTRDRLLRRIGLDAAPPADAGGLRTVHRAFVTRVPFENLTVQLGEAAPLDPGRLVERVLEGGRGGYCFEINSVFQLLLESLGFEVERRAGVVGDRGARAAGEPINHLALIVQTPDCGPFVADAGLGEGPLDPLPLAAGSVTIDVFTFRLEHEDDGWWVAFSGLGTSPGLWFADAPATLPDFEPHHQRLSGSPDSPFVRTLVVQQPYHEGIVTLRARTLSVDGPCRRERELLRDEGEFAATLRDTFGIDPLALGAERLARLWARAVSQHEAHQRLTAPAPH